MLSSHHTVVVVFTGVLVVGLGCAALLPGRRAAVTDKDLAKPRTI